MKRQKGTRKTAEKEKTKLQQHEISRLKIKGRNISKLVDSIEEVGDFAGGFSKGIVGYLAIPTVMRKFWGVLFESAGEGRAARTLGKMVGALGVMPAALINFYRMLGSQYESLNDIGEAALYTLAATNAASLFYEIGRKRGRIAEAHDHKYSRENNIRR